MAKKKYRCPIEKKLWEAAKASGLLEPITSLDYNLPAGVPIRERVLPAIYIEEERPDGQIFIPFMTLEGPVPYILSARKTKCS